MNFQRSINTGPDSGVRVVEDDLAAHNWAPVDLAPQARKGDAPVRAPDAAGHEGASAVPVPGEASVTLGPPRRRIPDADIVIVGRRRAEEPSEELRSFRRKAIGLAVAGLIATAIGLHVVRVHNLTGWTPVTIEEVGIEEA